MSDHDLIERAAQILCDCSPHSTRWADLSEVFRDDFRRRACALADAGLLTRRG